MKVLELFGGIGAIRAAMIRQDIEHEVVDYVEYDKFAVKSYNAMYGTNYEPQDVSEWDKDMEVDFILHGSPCQDFSIAGKQAGGDEGTETRSSLMFETVRIVKKTMPKYVIWENVKNAIGKKHKHNFDKYIEYLDELGYTSYYQVLNTKDYGVPQNRERVFCISILGEHKPYVFPEKQELKLRLKDMLEDEVEEKYYLSDKMVSGLVKHRERHESKGNGFKFEPFKDTNVVAKCISTRAGGRATDNFLEIKNATKKGYLEATDGDGIDLAYPDSKTRRGRVQEQRSHTITTSDNLGVLVDEKIKPSVAVNFKREIQEILTSEKDIYQAKSKSGWQDNKVGLKISPCLRASNNNTFGMTKDYRIRKLTPLECWRLQGFDDELFYKAQEVNSNSQLYKQAGNSITVNVLEQILKQLL